MKLIVQGMKTMGLTVMALALIPLGAAVSQAKTPPAPPVNGSQYEQWLNQQVHKKLITLPWFGVFDNLEYRIDGTQVTLLGQVVSQHAGTKSDAEHAVKSIEGVTNVVNEITVLPPSPMDDQIRRAELRAIYSEPALNLYGQGAVPTIHIIVNNGHVTLEGVVANEGDRNLANIRANEVPLVFSVTNNLRIG